MSDEIRLLSHKAIKSERLIIFLTVLLQQDKMIKKGVDICRLVSRQMTSWQEGNIDILIDEFECCAKRFSNSSPIKIDKDHDDKVFTGKCGEDRCNMLFVELVCNMLFVEFMHSTELLHV